MKGNSFNLEWGQDSPELGLAKGAVILNVPPTMFVRDSTFLHLSEYVRSK